MALAPLPITLMPSKAVSLALASLLTLIALCVLGVLASLPSTPPGARVAAVPTPPPVVTPQKTPQAPPGPSVARRVDLPQADQRQRALHAQAVTLALLALAKAKYPPRQ